MIRNCPVVSSYFLISVIIILFSLRNFQMTRLLYSVTIPGPKQGSITAQGEPPCKSEPLYSGVECHKPAEWLVGDHSHVSLVLVKVYPNVCVCKSHWVMVYFKIVLCMTISVVTDQNVRWSDDMDISCHMLVSNGSEILAYVMSL